MNPEDTMILLQQLVLSTLDDTCIHRLDFIKCKLVNMVLRLPYGTELSAGELINHSDKVLVVDNVTNAPTHVIAKVHYQE